MSLDKNLRALASLGVHKLAITIAVDKYAAPGEASVGGNVVQACADKQGGSNNAYANDIETAVARLVDNLQRHPITPDHGEDHAHKPVA